MNWADLRRKIMPRVFKGTIVSIEYGCEGPVQLPRERVSFLRISIRSKKNPNVVMRYPMGRIEFIHRVNRKGLAVGDSITIYTLPFSKYYQLLRFRRKAEMTEKDKEAMLRLLYKATSELEYMIKESDLRRYCPYTVRQLEHYQTEAVLSKKYYR